MAFFLSIKRDIRFLCLFVFWRIAVKAVTLYVIIQCTYIHGKICFKVHCIRAYILLSPYSSFPVSTIYIIPVSALVSGFVTNDFLYTCLKSYI